MAQPPRVLLVDDDPSVLELTGELLAMSGYAVVPELSGHGAVARLVAGEAFDALVTDHSMPEMTGEELIQRARLIAPGLRCLLVTGHGDSIDVVGGIMVLRKPFRIAHLAAALAELLGAWPADGPP